MAYKLTKKDKLKNIGYLLRLLSCAINETDPPEPEDDIDFDYIYRFAKIHMVANTAFYAVEKLNKKPIAPLMKSWEKLRNTNVHKCLIQTMEYSDICKAFQENKIKFLTFKGFEISFFYPKEEYRLMSDLDFLIKGSFSKSENIMRKLGYKKGERETSHESAFLKPPFMVVELHRNLFEPNSPFGKYYDNIFDRSHADNYRYKMTGEDAYIYNTVHLYKHYTMSGCGIRNVMDFYLMNKKLLPQLNKDYVETELANMNLLEFSEKIAEIGDKWFKSQDVEEFSRMERYILSSGAYGTKEKLITNNKEGKTKAEYVMYRLFPPLKWMQFFYRPLIKYPFLLPFFYIYRLIKAAFFNRKNIRYEINTLKKKEENQK